MTRAKNTGCNLHVNKKLTDAVEVPHIANEIDNELTVGRERRAKKVLLYRHVFPCFRSKRLCTLKQLLRLYAFKCESVYARRPKFLDVRKVKTIQTLNFMIPHVFPVLKPFRTALERIEIHTLLQILMDFNKSHGLRLPLIINMLPDED